MASVVTKRYCPICKDTTAHVAVAMRIEACVRCKITSVPDLTISSETTEALPDMDKQIVGGRKAEVV